MEQLLQQVSKYAIPIGVGISVLSMSAYSVDGGERAVIFDRWRGVLPVPVGEGMHFLIPWLQRRIMFDIRTRPKNIATTTGSKGIFKLIRYANN